MSFGLTSFDRALVTRVDSAELGSHDEASLFLTSLSLAPREDSPTVAARIPTRTSHLVTGPVSLPAICRCMGDIQTPGTDIAPPGLPRYLRTAVRFRRSSDG